MTGAFLPYPYHPCKVYLPTKRACFYDKCRQIYQSHGLFGIIMVSVENGRVFEMLTLGDTSWYINFSRKEFDTSIWRYILYTYLYTNHRRRCSSKGANIELRRATLFFLCFLWLAEIRSRLPRGPMFEFILNSCGGGGCLDLQKHAKNNNYLLILLIVFLVKMFNWIRIVQARVASRSGFFEMVVQHLSALFNTLFHHFVAS